MGPKFAKSYVGNEKSFFNSAKSSWKNVFQIFRANQTKEKKVDPRPPTPLKLVIFFHCVPISEALGAQIATKNWLTSSNTIDLQIDGVEFQNFDILGFSAYI